MVYNPIWHGRFRRGLWALLGDSSSSLLDGLVSWWDLDETSGTRADAVGSNDLTDINTVGYVDGKIGNGASFVSANNEYLEKTGFVLSDSWTVSGWVKGNGTNQAGRGWVGAYNAWASAVQFQIYAGAANVAYVLVGNEAGAYEVCQAYIPPSAPNFGDSDWFHFCAWFDASDQIVHLVLNDDVEYISASALPGTPYRTSAPLGFGDKPAKHDGYLDMVGIWNRALTADERTELYNAGAAIKNDFSDNGEGFREGLVAYYKLEEASGTRENAANPGTYDLTDVNTVGSATGKSGDAASFVEANSEYLTTTSPLPLYSDWAVSMWVKPSDTSRTPIWANGNTNGGPTQGGPAAELNVFGAGDVLVFLNNIFASYYYTGSGKVSAGSWNHVVVTFTGGEAEIWVNGTNEVLTKVGTPDDPQGDGPDFNLGRLEGAARFMDGLQDEVAVYSRLLSDDEIAALYAAGAGRFYDFQV